MAWLRRKRHAPVETNMSSAELVAPYGYNEPPAVITTDRLERLLVTVAIQSQQLQHELDRLSQRLDTMETTFADGQFEAALHHAHERIDELEEAAESSPVPAPVEVIVDLSPLAGRLDHLEQRLGILASANQLDMLRVRLDAIDARLGQTAQRAGLTALADRIEALETRLAEPLLSLSGHSEQHRDPDSLPSVDDLRDFKAHAARVAQEVARLNIDLRNELARIGETAKAAGTDEPPGHAGAPEPATPATAETMTSVKAPTDAEAEHIRALIDLTDERLANGRGYPLSI